MDSNKKIGLETEFANASYQDFKAKRFGLTPCCYSDLQLISLKKEICDWEELQAEVLTPTEGLVTKIVDCDTLTAS